MTTEDTKLDKLLALWSALDITGETDRVTGIERKSERENLLVQAILLSREMRPHPLDPYITEATEKWHKYQNPRPGQWWTDTDRVRWARMWNTVRCALNVVRLGDRPKAAIALMRGRVKIEPHMLDEAELKVWHYCRLAGLVSQ